jgi:hypothetical protein
MHVYIRLKKYAFRNIEQFLQRFIVQPSAHNNSINRYNFLLEKLRVGTYGRYGPAPLDIIIFVANMMLVSRVSLHMNTVCEQTITFRPTSMPSVPT